MEYFREDVETIEIVDSMETVEFDIDTGLYSASFDADRDPASLAVVVVVAIATDRDPLDLAPLHSAVDPTAMDTLCSGSATGMQGSTSFRYEGFDVAVFDGGTIEARPMGAA